MRSSTSKSLRRSSRSQSPCERWTRRRDRPATRCGTSRRPGAGPLAGGDVVFLRHAQGEQRRVGQEDQLASKPQESSRLGNPALRVGPQTRAILGDGEVEARVRIRNLLGVAMKEGKVEAVIALEPTGGGELRGGVVDSHHARSTPGEPGRHVGRAASQLDGVLAGEVVREHAELRLGHTPDAPRRLGPRPGTLAGGRVVRGLRVPQGAVAAHMLGQIGVVGHVVRG